MAVVKKLDAAVKNLAAAFEKLVTEAKLLVAASVKGLGAAVEKLVAAAVS